MIRLVSNLTPLTQCAIVFVSAMGLFFQFRWSRRGVALGPTLLTTLGIFFCFLGIALGLADFDPNNVKSSVPNLLQGIRTSFWVSVSGIGWALTIKIRYALFGDVAADETSAGATVDDLATHLMRLRTDSNTRLDRLHAAFESHSQQTAQANAEALIGVLAGVVHDFNGKLNEQFGENFKQLNNAVGQLVTWQTRYQEQLDRQIEIETVSSRTLTEAAQRYAAMIDNSTVFVQTAQSLSGLLGSLDAERDKLTNGLQMLGRLIDNAADGLPQIEKNILEMTDQISRGVQANQETMGAVLKSSWQSIQVHNQHLSAMLKKSLDGATQEVETHKRSVVA